MILLVVLRMAIGWHFFYEGTWKISETSKGVKPFSAQGYLSHTQGPFRDTFRGMVDDPDGTERLNIADLLPRWEGRALAFRREHGLNEDQWAKVEDKLAELQILATEYLEGDDGSKPIDAYVEEDTLSRSRQERYRKELAAFRTAESHAEMSFEDERVAEARSKLNSSRNMLLTPIKTWTAELDALLFEMKSEPKGWLAAKLDPFLDRDFIDNVTMWGLALGGACLLLGLFSRVAAVGSIVFLAMIYLSWPPWPGVAANPASPGHYLIVNPILIEMLALFVMVWIPTGRWAGLDALLHRMVIGRQGRFTEDIERRRLEQVPVTEA